MAPPWGRRELKRETRGSEVTRPHTRSAAKTPEAEAATATRFNPDWKRENTMQDN